MIPVTPSAVAPKTTSPVHSDSEIDPLDELCGVTGDQSTEEVSMPAQPAQEPFMFSTAMDGIEEGHIVRAAQQSLMMMVQIYLMSPADFREMVPSISAMLAEKPDNQAIIVPLGDGRQIKLYLSRLDNDENARFSKLNTAFQSALGAVNPPPESLIISMEQDMQRFLEESMAKGKAEYVNQPSLAVVSEEKVRMRMEVLKELGVNEPMCAAWASHKDFDVEWMIAPIAFVSQRQDLIPHLAKSTLRQKGKPSRQGENFYNLDGLKETCSAADVELYKKFILTHLQSNLK